MSRESAMVPESPLRIGYVLRMYPRFSQTFVVNEIRELERQGVDVRIASLRLPNEGTFHESVTKVRAQAQYLEEHFLGKARSHIRGQWNLLRRDPRQYAKVANLVCKHKGVEWFELCQAASLIRWARKEQVEHIHVHFGTDEANVAMFSRMMGGPSYSLTLHAFDIFRDNVDRDLLALKINASEFTVTVCQSNAEFLRSLPGVQPGKIHVIYNGIDLETFASRADAREPYSIFSVGRLIEKKGFARLIQAVARLRDSGLPVVCRIAGDGRDETKLRKLIHSLGLDACVHLLGAIRQDEVRGWMTRSACFALACVRAKDGNIDALPTVLLEAMACGCPCVSTRISGVPEIIDGDSCGMLVEPEDELLLAKAMEQVLTDGGLWSKLSVGGRKQAEARFDVRMNVAQLHNHFSTVVGAEARDDAAIADRAANDAQIEPMHSTQEAA